MIWRHVHIWSSYAKITCEHHMRSSYTENHIQTYLLVICEHHIWTSYVILVYDHILQPHMKTKVSTITQSYVNTTCEHHILQNHMHVTKSHVNTTYEHRKREIHNSNHILSNHMWSVYVIIYGHHMSTHVKIIYDNWKKSHVVFTCEQIITCEHHMWASYTLNVKHLLNHMWSMYVIIYTNHMLTYVKIIYDNFKKPHVNTTCEHHIRLM